VGDRLGRTLVALYGIACYVVALGAILYAMGFLSGFLVPKNVDSPATLPAGFAALVDVAMLAIFAVTHSIMARPSFKKWWTSIVPAASERSTYVMVAGAQLLAVFWLWQPIDFTIWNVEIPAIRIALGITYWAGWLLVLASTFAINHFDFGGLRQVYLHYRSAPYTYLPFKTTGLYGWVRHPIILGFLLVFWSAPTMTAGHLVFTIVLTTYGLAGTRMEELDLVDNLGEAYVDYRRNVGGFLPIPKIRR
jgi:protein-S-isoprenylcysteine O-methyltransferase Ste14